MSQRQITVPGEGVAGALAEAAGQRQWVQLSMADGA
jgi:hypothetical protein